MTIIGQEQISGGEVSHELVTHETIVKEAKQPSELYTKRNNLEAKKLMAADLISMGIEPDAVARILHLKIKRSSQSSEK